jgi:hypothetical protein
MSSVPQLSNKSSYGIQWWQVGVRGMLEAFPTSELCPGWYPHAREIPGVGKRFRSVWSDHVQLWIGNDFSNRGAARSDVVF